jgi:hypothetical protein
MCRKFGLFVAESATGFFFHTWRCVALGLILEAWQDGTTLTFFATARGCPFWEFEQQCITPAKRSEFEEAGSPKLQCAPFTCTLSSGKGARRATVEFRNVHVASTLGDGESDGESAVVSTLGGLVESLTRTVLARCFSVNVVSQIPGFPCM